MPALIFGAVSLLMVGFGSGWLIKDWKDGADVALAVVAKEKVESRNAILEAANTNCATDIKGVKSAVGVITKSVEEREKAASASMRDAETLVAKRKATIAAIKALPIVS